MGNNLFSKFIIDGVQQESTPADLLRAVASPYCCGLEKEVSLNAQPIVDETLDPPIEFYSWDYARLQDYLSALEKAKPEIPLPFAASSSRKRIATALCNALWRKGHFCLEDLSLGLEWSWNHKPVGAQAAFYSSVQACADYVDALGLQISDVKALESSSSCDLNVSVHLSDLVGRDDELSSEIKSQICLEDGNFHPSVILDDPQSWLIYVPFDTSDYHLGGSLLARGLGLGGGVNPQICDADYFIDCFEVVREFVEDGVLLSGVTVGDGGLIEALDRYCRFSGAFVDMSDILKSSGEDNMVRMLFAEVPGVLLQIRDIDFDYVDAEFLLQDVAYFPLGHPDSSFAGVRIKASAKSGIQKILESLMQNAEGED